MPVIFSRNFASGTQQYLTLGPSDYTRTLSIGSSWQRLRIGILTALSTVSENAWPLRQCSLSLGIGAGSASSVSVQAPAHAFGFGLPAAPSLIASANFTYNAGTAGNSYFSTSGTSYHFFKWAAGVQTTANVGSLATALPSNTTLGGALARRGILILDINKSALVTGNITQGVMVSAAGHMTVDLTSDNLYSALASPAGITIQGTAMTTLALGNSLTFNESINGILDTVFVYWSNTAVPLQLYEIGVYRVG